MQPDEPPAGVCHVLPVPPDTLERYRSALGLADARSALHALARAIAHSPTWDEHPRPDVLAAGAGARPALAFFGALGKGGETILALLGRELLSACDRLTYLDFAAARREVAVLAGKLHARLGAETLSAGRFVAIPRGGLVVLGMLAYELGLEREQVLSAPADAASGGGLTVLVDDCALSGARTAEALAVLPRAPVVLAHLRSHPAMRQALLEREPRVTECVAAADLASRGQDDPAATRRWIERLPERRIWTGSTEPVVFAWSEPDRCLWNPHAERIEPAWNLAPPELCLRHRGAARIPVFEVPRPCEGLAPAADVVWAETPEAVLVGRLGGGAAYRLEGDSAAIWSGLVAGGESTAERRLEARGHSRRRASDEVRALRSELRAAGLVTEG